MRVSDISYAAVKGCRHTHPAEADIGPLGLAGDRELAFVDATALTALRTVAHPELLTLTAEFAADILTLTTSDGPIRQELREGRRATVEYWSRPIEADLYAGAVSAAVSEYLRKPVVLAHAVHTRFVYAEPVTLILRSEVAAVADRIGVPDLDARRFRANVVIDDLTEPVAAQHDWLGSTIQIGEVCLSVVGRVQRCTVIDRNPATGERDLPVFRHLGSSSAVDTSPDTPPGFGYAAMVLHPGQVHLGDVVI